MVHTFQCLGVNIAVDVNSGAVHVLDELTYHLLEQVQPPMGEHCPAELCARLPQYDPAALEEAWQELRGLAAEGLLFEATCGVSIALPPPAISAPATA